MRPASELKLKNSEMLSKKLLSFAHNYPTFSVMSPLVLADTVIILHGLVEVSDKVLTLKSYYNMVQDMQRTTYLADALARATLSHLPQQTDEEKAARQQQIIMQRNEYQVQGATRLTEALISITNSVPGGPPRKGQGMALHNVRERLQLLHDLTMRFEAGAIEGTVQMCQAPTYLDQIGIRKLETTQSYGNWQAGTLSRLIEPVFRNYRRLGVGAACSLRVKSKDQYRVLYSDGSGVLVYFGRKTPELMLFKYLVTPFCACSTEEGPEAAEEIYIGASDGYVYRVDAGQNYDGEAITAAIRLPFNSLKSPTYLKRYIKATLEVDASASTEIFQTAEFAYADSNVPASPEQAFVVRGGGGFWDEANWDQFYWSAPTQGLAEAYIAGIGQNVSIAVLSETTHEDPHTLTAMTLNYSVRRQIR